MAMAIRHTAQRAVHSAVQSGVQSGVHRVVPERSGDDELARLRAQLDEAQGRRVRTPPLPTHPLIADLLPDGGLRPGETYAVSGSTSLLLALLAPVSRSGSWCAAIGMPTLGAEAARAHGIDLARLVLVPEPGSRWLAVTSAIAEVLPIVAVRPTARVGDADISRLSARLRDRGTVLLVQGTWPQAHAMLSIDEPRWAGLGDGHGLLETREVTVTVSSRRWPVPRAAPLLLPDAGGALAPARRADSAQDVRTASGDLRTPDERHRLTPLRAVG